MCGAFWKKVHKTDNCWYWKAALNKGYGVFWYDGRVQGAHRVSYILNYGEIPEDMHVLHHCDNRVCVNPDHLFLGTNIDNVADKVAKHRHCRGQDHGSAKLTENQVKIIRRNKGKITQTALANFFSVNQSTVSMIHRNRLWREV